VALFPKSFDVLLYLVQNAGRVVSKEELLKAVWADTFVEESNLSQSISLLRKALEERPGENRYIITVPGKGYQFGAATEEIADSDRGAPGMIVQAIHERITAVVEETQEPELALPEPAKARRTVFVVFGMVGAGLLILGGWAAYRHWRPAQALAGQRELVLADFENTTGDPNFDHILNEALKIDLGQSPYFTFLSREKVQETLAQMQRSRDAALTPDVAREVCERNNAQAVLDGAVARFGHQYLITLNATDCASGAQLAEDERRASDEDEVPGAIDAIAADLRHKLGESHATVKQYGVPLFAENTGSFEALTAYSQAEHLVLQGKYEQAVPLYQRAIEIDPRFAVADLDLAGAYTNLGDRELEVTYLKKAYELRDNADEQDRLHIVARYHDTVTGDLYESLQNYRTWSGIYPQNPVPWMDLADTYTQIGQPEEAIEPAKHALTLAPNNPVAYVVLARAEMHAGQLEAARTACEQAMQRHLDGSDLHNVLMQLEFAQHDHAGIEREIVWAKSNPSGSIIKLNEARIAFAQGQVAKGQQMFEESAEAYRQQGLAEHGTFLLLASTRFLAEEGETEEARKLLDTLSLQPGMTDPLVAMALTGEGNRALPILQQDMQQHPTDTLWQRVKGPQIRAAIFLSEHKPEQAVDALQPSIPFDLRAYDLPLLRGEAYLEAKQPTAAEVEFRKILDHPGVDPLSYQFPLAQLYLARAYAAEGRVAEARMAYGAFFGLWKNADPDLALLKKAKGEAAALDSSR
jgi:eukaryotic-like serine/threonine-protein kinase